VEAAGQLFRIFQYGLDYTFIHCLIKEKLIKESLIKVNGAGRVIRLCFKNPTES